jgi:hypothetical protein
MFAFGVMAFELFAFELPWPRGADGLAAMAHGVDKPADIRKYYPRINPTVAEAIEKCLHPEPAKRPESMDQFLQMVKDVQREDAP